MRNILVFLDGTQSRSEGDHRARLTNVAKLFAIAPSSTSDGTTQLKFYLPGVGAYSVFDKWHVLAGVGVQRSVRQAYQFISANFEPKDRIFIFGFSRGAFSARLLAGLIARAGILQSADLALTLNAYDWYRYTVTGRPITGHMEAARRQTRPACVQFLGLWDTVASTRVFQLGRNTKLYNGRLEPAILNVRHALAKNERRFTFYPQTYKGENDQYHEKWFPGYHCDVGGGYSEEKSGLSNATLRWMMKEAESCGLILPEKIPLDCVEEGSGTPREYPWTRFLNRPRAALYNKTGLPSQSGAPQPKP